MSARKPKPQQHATPWISAVPDTLINTEVSMPLSPNHPEPICGFRALRWRSALRQWTQYPHPAGSTESLCTALMQQNAVFEQVHCSPIIRAHSAMSTRFPAPDRRFAASSPNTLATRLQSFALNQGIDIYRYRQPNRSKSTAQDAPEHIP